MNAGEIFLEYTSINPITLLSTPNIVVYLSYRNPAQFNNGVSINNGATITGDNFSVNINNTGGIGLGTINLNCNHGTINITGNGAGIINIGSGNDVVNINGLYTNINGNKFDSNTYFTAQF